MNEYVQSTNKTKLKESPLLTKSLAKMSGMQS